MSFPETFDTLFLDRDGVLNRKIDDSYVLNHEDIEILEGIPEFLARVKSSFKRIIVVTNQRCVGRHLLSHERLASINDRINELTGSLIDRFYVCPHLDEDRCDCRKPKNGLFLQAAAHYPVDFPNSWMIGDSETDIVPAANLGIRTVRILNSGTTSADMSISKHTDLIGLFKSE